MPPAAERFDVFVSYNRRDTGAAEALASSLRERGFSVFLDHWCLQPGDSWPWEIEKAVLACSALVTVIGPGEMGGWQRNETYLALDREQRDKSLRIIPVLVPGGDPPLGFLRLKSWVDLRSGVGPGAFDRLPDLLRGTGGSSPLSICPYRGLRPFRQEDAEFFFGRKKFISDAANAVARHKLTAIVGASGSGKSSAVRAGLLPHLYKERDRTRWTFLVVVPGDRPLHSLAASVHSLLEPGLGEVARLGEIEKLAQQLATGMSLRNATDRLLSQDGTGGHVLLFVDQWEELYTHCDDAALRTRFIDAVLEAATDTHVSAVFTVRGDFFGHVLGYRPLADRLDGKFVSLGPMNTDELRQCIEEPATRVELQFESGLVRRILEDVERGAGNLPLLEFVLSGLWEQRQAKSLVHEAYDRMGEVRGAVATRADQEFARLDETEQKAVRKVMLQLVHTGAGMVDTRRRTTRSRIGEAAWPVVLKLADARLLVTGRDEATKEETVEVAHEALIHSWSMLRRWLKDDHGFLLWRQQLATALEQHQRDPRDEGTLLRGELLAEAQRWRDARGTDLSEAERAFIARSTQRARLVLALRILYAAAMAAVTIGLVGLGIRWIIDVRFRRDARVLSLAARQGDPVVAALLVAELSERKEPVSGARVAREIANRAIPIAVLDRGHGQVRDASISPDGSTVLIGYDDGAILLWPAAGDGVPALLDSTKAPVTQVGFSPDGSLAVGVREDGSVTLWRVGLRTVVAPWGPDGPAQVASAAFDSSGSQLLTASDDGVIRIWPLAGSQPPEMYHASGGTPLRALLNRRWVIALVERTVEVWDRTQGDQPTLLEAGSDVVVSAEFDRRGSRLLTASRDGSVRLWDLATRSGKVVFRAGDGAAWTAQFDASGDTVVAAFDDGLVRMAAAESSGGSSRVFEGHQGVAWMARFRPGGGLVASAGEDSTGRLWATDGRAAPIVLRGHRAAVFAVGFSANGSRLITVARDGSVRVWNGAGRVDPIVLRAETGSSCSGAVSPNGSRIALACSDGVAWVWKTDSAKGIPLVGHHGPLAKVAFDSAGERVVTASGDSTAAVWSARDGRELDTLRGHRGSVTTAEFSPDGQRIVTGSSDRLAAVWSGPGFQSFRELAGHKDIVLSATFSPEGSRVATGSADGTAMVWYLRQPPGLTVLRGHTGPVRQVTFSPDGSLLVTASEDSTARVWNLEQGDTVLVARGHQGWVWSAVFDGNGKRIVTAAEDGIARVWRIAGQDEPVVLKGHRGLVLRARFSHDGRLVATAGLDSTARVYRLDQHGAEMVLPDHDGAVRDAVFLPDDSRLVTISDDGTARVWRVSWRALHAYLQLATSACLTREQRIALLGEGAAKATDRFRRCEHDHGRLSRL